MDTSKIVGEKIKSLRENKGISIEELAERSGLAIEQIERIENKDRKSTRLNSSHITRSRMPSSA